MLFEGVHAGEVGLVLVVVAEGATKLARVAPPLDRRPGELVAAVLEALPVAGAALLEGVRPGAKLGPGHLLDVVDFGQRVGPLVNIGAEPGHIQSVYVGVGGEVEEKVGDCCFQG